MPLTDADIAKLLLVADKPARKRKGGIDYSLPTSRTFQNWFALGHKLYDEKTGDMPKCENPECPDKRARGSVVVELPVYVDSDETIRVCRYCFIAGFGSAPVGVEVE